jgi:deazaflavin-dependent oxidoreductase (nitroreductase family)
MSDWNARIISEFRQNGGTAGVGFAGRPLLLHHFGARSGRERVSPLMDQAVDGGYAIFASKGGAHTHPVWAHNLKANPRVAVEVRAETIPVTAREASADERQPIWSRQKTEYPFFAEYGAGTERMIAVFIRERNN